MSGKRILDAIALLRASRNVAYNHFAIRLRQAELYTKTSSLTKSLRQQKPAIWVATSQAFSQSARANTGENDSSANGLKIQQEPANRHALPDGTIPPKNSPIGAGEGDATTESRRPSIEPAKTPLNHEAANDLHPTSSSQSRIPTPTNTHLSAEEARILQRQSEDQIPATSAEPPDADGEPEFSVEQEKDIYYQPPGRSSPVLSALPRVRLPKIENDIQGGDAHIPKGINADVYYSGAEQGKSHEPSEEQLSQLFHSPRSAQLLGKKGRYLPKGLREMHTSSVLKQQNSEGEKQDLKQLAKDMAADLEQPVEGEFGSYQMKESRVPSSRVGRLFEYGGLAASMAFGAVSESMSGNKGGSLMLSPANMERLVAKLSKMRGAALKLGQMVSFQDIKMLPPPVVEILQRVQDSADYMPVSQRDKVIASDLGSNWKDLFQSFDEKPIAAASIGQVHGAVLKSGQPVAVKVQYPGVATSISSDLNNLSLLLHATRLLPKGLYLDRTIANARVELAWECDYIREAEAAKRFRKLLEDDTEVFTVPAIIDEASGKQVLTMERMQGVAVTKVRSFDQEQRDWIGTQILRLCLREIMEFKYMQTDPNWTNFLYNRRTNKLELLDFGASRDYPEKFVRLYTGVLQAASRKDRKKAEELSIELGYLTGYDTKAMVNAHIDSIMVLAEPFMDFAPDVYDFRDQTITDRVRSFIPTMLRERLAPPPEETYSLHRKMSGAFLLCARLGSKVRCKELFHQALKKGGLE